jgi:chemotaxis protein CheD
MFADTGIPLLLENAFRLGAMKSRLIVMAAGGAQMLDPNGTFNIGQRNQAALRKMFWKAGILIRREDLGGNVSRTLRIEVSSGRVQLRKPGEPEHEMAPNSIKIGAGNGLQYSHRR